MKKKISPSAKNKTTKYLKKGIQMSQFSAVKNNAEVRVNNFQFQAAPSEFKKELITDQTYKRFHGSRTLLSWLPPGLIENTKDRFGYMFPRLRKTKLPFTDENIDLLKRLGEEMGRMDPASRPDSTIPAGYTYLGQFIDHDITLDINSDITKSQDASLIPNMRSPSLDLDAIYGQGPALDPFLFDHAEGPGKGVKLLLGRNTDTGDGGPSLRPGPNNFGNPALVADGNNFDVQRTSDFTAIIGDPRNDENLFVSQLHHAFIKFHNKVVDRLISEGFNGDLFTEAKRITTHHYQWVVVHDFLKRLADPAIIDSTLNNGPKHFNSRDFFMPVEFSVAAYRFGHSIIRNDYFVNGPLTGQLGNQAATLGQIFEFVRVKRLPVFSNWVLDFNLLFPAMPIPTVNNVKFNMARKIDTRLASGLGDLPGETDAFLKVLAKRNLVRGLALGLPNGQAVARFLNVPRLTQAELTSNNTVEMNNVLQEANGKLLRSTPLWYYILKESEVKTAGNRLGKVGSIILAETFVRLLKEDQNSYVNSVPGFLPSLPRFGGRPIGDFDMTDILAFAGVLTLD